MKLNQPFFKHPLQHPEGLPRYPHRRPESSDLLPEEARRLNFVLERYVYNREKLQCFTLVLRDRRLKIAWQWGENTTPTTAEINQAFELVMEKRKKA